MCSFLSGENQKKVKSYAEPLNLLPLLCFHPGGVQKELAAQSSPTTKVDHLLKQRKIFSSVILKFRLSNLVTFK